MPEFERKKRKSLSDQQLFDEYYGIDKKKPVKNSSKSKKNVKLQGNPRGKSKSPKRENPPVSPERQRIKERYPEENAVRTERTYPGKKKKASAGKKAGAPKKRGKSAAKGKNKGSYQGKGRKKQRHGSYVLYYFLGGIVAVAVVTILSVTVLFNIKRFEVTGETQYADEEIIEAAGIEIGENLLRIDIGEAEKKITSKLVYIDNAQIKRGFPDKLVINAEPAVPMACFYISGKYYLVSEAGRVLEISNKRFEVPIVKGYVFNPEKEGNPETETREGGALEEDGEKRIAAAVNIIGYMRSSGLDKDFVIDLTDILSIKVTYDNRIEMELGTTAAMDEKIFNAARLILDHNEIAENEKCVLILTNPYRVPKQAIRDQGAQTEGYIVTTESEPEETQPEENTESTAASE